jgi:hypothetical protein
MAFGADADFAALCNWALTSPEIPTINATKYYRAIANIVRVLWTWWLKKPTETVDIYVRTSNIQTDNTSWWTLVDETNDISGFAWTSSIQYQLRFRTIWESCLPARLLWFNTTYEDNSMLENYSLSEEKSSSSSKVIAFYFNTAFWWTVPALRINIYDINTAWLLLTDTTTASANWVWEKTTDWTTWTAYNTSDRANTTTWIRYTPTSISDNVVIKPIINLA